MANLNTGLGLNNVLPNTSLPSPPASQESSAEEVATTTATEAATIASNALPQTEISNSNYLAYLPNITPSDSTTATETTQQTLPSAPVEELKRKDTLKSAFTYLGVKLGNTDSQGLPKIGSIFPDKDVIIPWKQDLDDKYKSTYTDPDTGIKYVRVASLTGYHYSITDKEGNFVGIETDLENKVTDAVFRPVLVDIKDIIKNEKQLAELLKLTDGSGWKLELNGQVLQKTVPGALMQITLDVDGKGTIRYFPNGGADGKYIDIDKDGKVTEGVNPPSGSSGSTPTPYPGTTAVPLPFGYGK